MSASGKPDFKGSGVLFLRNVFLYLLVSAPVLSVCLMGAKCLPIFLGVFILVLPFVLLVGLLVSRFDGFSFDDERQMVVKPLGRSIPYQSVLRIDLNETGGLLQARIKQGALRRPPLAYALQVEDKARLVEDLRKRFPQAVIREQRYVDWKSLAMIMALVVIMTAGFHVFVYQDNPQIGVLPQRTTWVNTELPATAARQYALGSFHLIMPGSFQLIAKDIDALLFEDAASKTEVKFVTAVQRDPPANKFAFVRYATGIRNYFDVLETAYSARVGVIPLAIKGIALAGLSNISILDIRQPSLKGFVLQGKKKENEIARILLTDLEGRAEIHIFITGPVRLDEKALHGILTTVHLFHG